MARTRARRSRKRRRDLFMGLLASAISSAALGFFVPQLWALHAVVDVLLVAYVLVLLRMRHGTSLVSHAPVYHASAIRAEGAREYAYVYSRD